MEEEEGEDRFEADAVGCIAVDEDGEVDGIESEEYCS